MGNNTSIDKQSQPYGAQKAQESRPRIAANVEQPPTHSKMGADVDNLYALFQKAAQQHPHNNCFGHRQINKDQSLGEFTFQTYKHVQAKATHLGAGVATLNLPPKSTFAMYMANCETFQIITLGCFSRGLTCVPVYDTLGDNILTYELNHADVPILFVEASKLASVAAVLKDCPSLNHVVLVQELSHVDSAVVKLFDAAGVNLTDVASLSAAGAAKPIAASPPSGDDLAFIMYTSGTTGDPKGVCLKQLSITVGATWCAGLEILPTDRYLSYLPLAHIFETMVEFAMLSHGGSIGFFNGNIKKLNEDVLALKPTIFAGVPRVYQRFYEAAMQKIDALGGLKKKLISYMLAAQTEYAKQGKWTPYSAILAKALGAKITGGSVRIMISGAAPLPVHVHEFLLACMGCPVVQGYGMTENCANATLANLADWRAGHVGPPMPTTEIKLVDVAEMNYTSAGNNSGEVCTRSLCTFAGYHKNQAETDKVLEADGWLHTGDIGRWNTDGTLSIIDRKKNIFKLAQGEYVAAEKIEMIVSKSKYVAQPWIYGNSFFPMLVAVVTPDWAELAAAAKQGGWFIEPQSALAEKPQAKKFILDQMVAEAKQAKLKSFELPRAVVLEPEINELMQGFSIANDCLTPTFKLKRPQLLKRYQKQIDSMYVSLGEDPSKYKK